MLSGSHTAGGAKNITVRLEQPAVLSGRVRDAKTNAPLAGVTVEVALPGLAGIVGPAAITDAGGAYALAVPAGSQAISITHPSYVRDHVSVRPAPGQQWTRDFALTQLARVSGVVLDEGNRPAAAAMVSPHDARDRGIPDMPANGVFPATAGPDGKFSVRVLPGHDLYLRLWKRAFPRGRSEVMKLAAGERKSEVVLTLPAGVAVTGRVLDAGGKPLAGVSVVAGPAPAPGGVETLDTLFPPVEPDPIRTDAGGRFAMRLKEGPYHFTFKREGYLAKQVRGKSITAAGGNAVEARLDPAVEISGRVTRGGAGIADVEVSSYGNTSADATTAADGSFTLGGFAPGVKQLGLRKAAERIDETRSVTAPARGVVIDLPRGGTIRGRVVEKATKAPIRSFRAGVMVGLGNLSGFSSEDGSFTIDHVPAGEITLAVDAFGYAATTTDVAVVDGQTAAEVVIELEQGARLTGRVTDAKGAPVSGVSVTIIPANTYDGVIGGFGAMSRKPVPAPVSNNYATAVTDADGKYALEGLSPATEDVHFAHPRFVETKRTVTLGRDTKLDVQLSAPQP